MSFIRKLPSYIPALRRYAYALTNGDSQLVDDLIQDTLERAVKYQHQWQEDTDLRAWLFTIMHNHFANQYKRKQNSPKFVKLLNQGDTIANSEKAETSLYLRDLESALKQLNEQQREIIVLVIIEGMSYKEVSNVLSIPVGTVMSRLSRARQQLQESLTADSGGFLQGDK